ncbi:MAG TPA: magnesium transporter [Candidatus Nanoarchaeia archaeon]|nr:magnesium transporter [Candidatus Nanoarchaeia archaeon]
MKLFDNNFKEILTAQIIFVFIGLIAGTILAVYTDKILLIPGMLILLPGFLEMKGNIGGTLSSRITSGLFLGVINKNNIKTKIIKTNLLASFCLVIIISTILGLIAFIFNYLLLKEIIYEIILIPILASILSNSIELPLGIFATFYLFKKGHDPSNIMGPFIASLGDITSIVSLLVVMVFI